MSGYFESKQEKKKLIIVHSKNKEKFADLLVTLIGTKDDKEDSIVGVKDDSIDVVVWTEEQYRDQKPQLVNTAYNIVYIGTSNAIEKECFGLLCRYKEYGMTYFEGGNKARCVVTAISKFNVVKLKALHKKFQDTLHLYEDRVRIQTGFRDVVKKNWPVLLFPFSIWGAIPGYYKYVDEWQYTTLVLITYLNYLNSFLNQ